MRIVRILTATVLSVCLATSALAQTASPASKLSVSGALGAKARQGAALNKPGKALGLDAPTPILIAMVVGAALYFALHKSDPKSP
jgi:hypothetical protein